MRPGLVLRWCGSSSSQWPPHTVRAISGVQSREDRGERCLKNINLSVSFSHNISLIHTDNISQDIKQAQERISFIITPYTQCVKCQFISQANYFSICKYFLSFIFEQLQVTKGAGVAVLGQDLPTLETLNKQV